MSEIGNPYVDLLGISPEDCPPNYYQLLGLPMFESSPEAVQSALAARMGVLKRIRTAENTQTCQRLVTEFTAARICLLNSNRKSAYDKGLRHAMGEQVSESGDNQEELPAQTLLKVMSRQRMLSASIVEEWTLRTQESPTPLTAVQLSKQLVDAGVVTFGIAKRLLVKTRELAETMAVEGKSLSIAQAASDPGAANGAADTSMAQEAKTQATTSQAKEIKPIGDDELELAPFDNAARRPGPRLSATSGSKSTAEESTPATAVTPTRKVKEQTDGGAAQPENESSIQSRLAEELAADAGLGPLDELSADDMLEGSGADDFTPLKPRRYRGLAGWFADIVPRNKPTTIEEAREKRNQSRLLALLLAGAVFIIVLVVILAISVFSKTPREQFFAGDRAFQDAKDQEAIEYLNIFITENPEHGMLAEAYVKLAVATLRLKVKQAQSPAGLFDDFYATLTQIKDSPYFSAVRAPFGKLMLDTVEKMAEQGATNKLLIKEARKLLGDFERFFPKMAESEQAIKLRNKLEPAETATPPSQPGAHPDPDVPPAEPTAPSDTPDRTAVEEPTEEDLTPDDAPSTDEDATSNEESGTEDGSEENSSEPRDDEEMMPEILG